MEITLDSKVADTLDAYPFLEEVLIGISSHFRNLQNPALRNTAAKVTPLRHAADVAGMEPEEFLNTLKRAIEAHNQSSTKAEG